MTKKPELKKEIKARHYFSLAFGSIIGVGWVMILGDWLEIAGPLGAMIGFALGVLVMLIVGLCYAELSSILPVSGGEVVFTYEIFGLKTCYIVSWYLTLAFIVVTSFETISVGWIASLLFPQVRGPMLYMFNGGPIYLGNLLLGLGGMALITYLNYRRMKSAASFQEILTYCLLICSLIFICAGIFWGKPANLAPLFSKTGTVPVLGGILAIFMTVPNWMAGFNIIPQTLEERSPGTSIRLVVKLILVSIFFAGCFYILVIFSASMASPWKTLLPLELPAAGAFEAAFKSPLLAKIVLLAALCGMITTWNVVFISASRILFSLGRAHIIPPVFSTIHGRFGTPSFAVIFIGIVGTTGAFLGRNAILPIVNVIASSFSLAFFFTCLGLIKLRYKRPDQPRPFRIPAGKVVGGIGAVFCLFMLGLSLYTPYVQAKGSFPLEWIYALIWIILGAVFWIATGKARNKVTDAERRRLILAGLDISEKS